VSVVRESCRVRSRPSLQCGRHLAFVGWGLFWGLMDGLLGGAVVGGVSALFLGAPVAAMAGAFVLGILVGAIIGAVVGAPVGVLVGTGLGVFAACQRQRGTQTRTIADQMPDVVTIFVVLVGAATAIDTVVRTNAAHSASDAWAWLVMAGAIGAAVVLGRLSSRSIARWYMSGEPARPPAVGVAE
jgi:hypothetical protein